MSALNYEIKFFLLQFINCEYDMFIVGLKLQGLRFKGFFFPTSLYISKKNKPMNSLFDLLISS